MNSILRTMLLALCTAPDLAVQTNERTEGRWWSEFVREMEAIGCVNVRQDIHGEWAFDCPSEKLTAARAIVARYSVK